MPCRHAASMKERRARSGSAAARRRRDSAGTFKNLWSRPDGRDARRSTLGDRRTRFLMLETESTAASWRPRRAHTGRRSDAAASDQRRSPSRPRARLRLAVRSRRLGGSSSIAMLASRAMAPAVALANSPSSCARSDGLPAAGRRRALLRRAGRQSVRHSMPRPGTFAGTSTSRGAIKGAPRHGRRTPRRRARTTRHVVPQFEPEVAAASSGAPRAQPSASSTRAPAISGGSVTSSIGSTDGNIYALRALRRTRPLEPPDLPVYVVRLAGVIDHGTLYAGSYDGSLYALATDTGRAALDLRRGRQDLRLGGVSSTGSSTSPRWTGQAATASTRATASSGLALADRLLLPGRSLE